MGERSQILFMQIRLIRLASDEWHMTIKETARLFGQLDILSYIETGFGSFHCEGDYAVLEDIEEFLERKGMKINAETG